MASYLILAFTSKGDKIHKNHFSSPVHATKIKVNAVWENLYPFHIPYKALSHIPKINRVKKNYFVLKTTYFSMDYDFIFNKVII